MRDMPLAGWGDPARRSPLPAHALAWLRRRLGPLTAIPGAPLPPPAASRLTDEDARVLGAICPVLTGDGDRLLRGAGKSYLDLLAARSGSRPPAPDAVLLPADAGQVAAVLAACTERLLAVVPFGGGTSVVGALRPQPGGHRAVLALDLRRMDRLLELDEHSRLATFEPGVRGPDAERALAAHGLTLGHLPQSFEFASIGGFVATRSAGQASSGYGRIPDLVVGLELATPAGLLRCGRGAASAAGPDLRELLVGSEGAFGVVTAATLRVRPAPAVRHYEARLVSGWAAGQELLRQLAQDGLLPDVARLSDPVETEVNLALATNGLKGAAVRGYLRARGGRERCLLVLGWEGDGARVRQRRRASRRLLSGTAALGTRAGERWRAGRYDGPYLRDELLAAGVLVETLETSARWSSLPETDRAVRAALRKALPGALVLCHLSHLYPHGASLYFTVLGAADRQDPAGQWRAAKRAATEALLATGATLTHHHGVGADHQPWLAAEIGELGVAVLTAVKRVLDPAGIMNPGTLLPIAADQP